ncbi:MAG: hypothetical protein A2655_00360 [Candidatus Yanofskybacteria bacterium RIFCSPHIGHO2_01_FULL_43_42]|uniref:Phosphoglycerate mutase n=1 Tax=Candidatus Taylorbacteria bacterium RIFCSPLOWO2_01_FULL_45_15b TaxID=1802319 RepID=A0A1G2NHE7_9BACT|nr:MAG: hypothetical protein A2655_00360 [Candidatus Yanofskybacteria bacterium RIFCSPHIGHO2_01_FULL_43_42]OHA34762.1 MAG: hypothetical protein A2928_02865 [Candidatus Taylorbacteria bacterium RIFCSPLOWO2_01_FULL_45_15b]
MYMKITLVRHGLTDSNKAKRAMASRADESLNEEGIRQAHALAETIRRMNLRFETRVIFLR